MGESKGDPSRLETDTQTASKQWVERVEMRTPTLTLIAHPERNRVGERTHLPSLNSGRTTRLARGEPGFAQPGTRHERPLEDPKISRSPILLRGRIDRRADSVFGSLQIDSRRTRALVEVDGRPLNGRADLDWVALERGVVLCLSREVVLLLHLSDPVPTPGLPTYGMVGASSLIDRVRSEIQRLAPLEVPVLVRGETGTGKELVAKALHQAGPRAGGPFVAINMAALQPSLAAAELFGAVKGAYTGSTRTRRGAFQRAEGGTLFLDEIGDMLGEVQVLLLRALESREVLPVGAETPRPVDVRLITATDLDLETAIDSGRFRSPLLYRLAGYEIHLPPLRRRKEDFGRLFFHFIDHQLKMQQPEGAVADSPPWPLAEIIARLLERPWPGNVRQLRNAARQLGILGPGASSAQIARWLETAGVGRRLKPSSEPGVTVSAPTRRRPGDISDDELIETLRTCRYRVKDAAQRLGISRAAVYKLIERSSGVRKAGDVGRSEISDALEDCGGDLVAMVDRLKVSAPALRRRMRQLGFD